MKDLTQKLLHELFEYRDDGNLYWKVSHTRVKVGDIAGYIWISKDKKSSYRIIGIYRKYYRAHRLIWMFHHGFWPNAHLDHIDGDSVNNRTSNLREATSLQNNYNVGIKITNTSGYKGVYLSNRKVAKKYIARIRIKGKRKYLGSFYTAFEASLKYNEVAKQIHGEFYRETL